MSAHCITEQLQLQLKVIDPLQDAQKQCLGPQYVTTAWRTSEISGVSSCMNTVAPSSPGATAARCSASSGGGGSHSISGAKRVRKSQTSNSPGRNVSDNVYVEPP